MNKIAISLPISLPRLLCAMALLAGTAATHAELNSTVYGLAKDEIKASYKADRTNCNAVSGNAKDICLKTIRGHEDVALAHLQMQRTGTAKDTTKLAQARYNARYAVAVEVCDDLSGNPKSLCRTQAKADHDKAKAEVLMKTEVREAISEADSTKLKADHKVATERCASLNGATKDGCMASANARYGM